MLNINFSKLRKKRSYFWILSILSGLMSAAVWYTPFIILVPIIFTPLLEIENLLYERGAKRSTWALFKFVFVSFLICNLGVYWWIWNVASWLSFLAWLINTALLTLPFLVYHTIKKKSVDKLGPFTFVCCWLAFEYLHKYGPFAWIWLDLGNLFSGVPILVQWYEYTGVLGGSLWVVLLNVWFYQVLFQQRGLIGFFLVLFIPSVWSFLLNFGTYSTDKSITVIAVQPNIDPYAQKLNYKKTNTSAKDTYMASDLQFERLMQLSESVLSHKVRLILWPETSMVSGFEDAYIRRYDEINTIRNWYKKYPYISILAGADTYTVYGSKKGSQEAYHIEGLGYIDAFNAALFTKKSAPVEFYYKSKLVIGEETMPFSPALSSFVLDLHGTPRPSVKNHDIKVLETAFGVKVAPIICYESVYGDYVGDFVRKGAQIITIITNDGWWGNTRGYQKHLNYARLRAIEHRRPVIRSANVGVSAFIDTKGSIYQKLDYDTMGALKGEVLLNNRLTFYSKYGDYLGVISMILTIFLILSQFVNKEDEDEQKTSSGDGKKT
ncbi:apolipoprotein N-acyltransferase [Sediminitomix flava]|uniref:Apolipoprotein N-acyltransferase n=1 Tax=Sediminitomix flava TaxID=379075 RepID=A0A315ZCG6_SEDFL|nr:apolipoprotein N-acyltransferase [Sediminitomix flava]PWJ43275.1 apolipoprotein N-acyltransferase [Sediminitomix flava]